MDDGVTNGQGSGLSVNLDATSAGNAGLAHATSDNGRVGSHTAVGGQNALADDDTVNVVRGGFEANEDNLLALGATLSSNVSVENSLTNSSTR